METIENLAGHYPDGKIVKLTFVGEQTERPLITSLNQKL